MLKDPRRAQPMDLQAFHGLMELLVQEGPVSRDVAQRTIAVHGYLAYQRSVPMDGVADHAADPAEIQDEEGKK